MRLLPMRRDPQTPLILWVCAAVCAHYMFAQGGGVVAEVHDDQRFVREMVSTVRGRLPGPPQTLEINVTGDEDVERADEPQPPEPEAKKDEPKKDEPEEKKPEPPKPEEKKPEQKKLEVVVKEEDPAKKLDPPPTVDKRIAVKQHAKENQDDNPEARFVGDQANHVEEETVATQTNHAEDDPNPTPGGIHAGPTDAVGDSERTKIADLDDRRGEKDRAPGEKGTEFEVEPHELPKIAAVQPTPGPKAPEAPSAGGDGRPAAAPDPSRAPEPSAGAAPAESPEVAQGATGWSFNPTSPGSPGGAAPAPGVARATPRGGPARFFGLGAAPVPGQVNLNLSHQGVVAAVGMEKLQKERVADGERRRSEHRGSWQASSFERWRSAIENYVSTVKPGNQTALNTAASPFATYLVTIHNRIHPIFADSFLSSIDGLPRSHPMSDPKIFTRLEIVVSKEGRLVKMGVVRTSGVTAFDIAALDAVNRASPFGPPPSAIVSSDGNVYLHWEFHRDEMACSTMFARPFMLNVPPKPSEPAPPPPGPGPSREEHGAPPASTRDTRQGGLAPAVRPRPIRAPRAGELG